jgi:prepilin-type N-terminal cleavage/methylation domain-containing protein
MVQRNRKGGFSLIELLFVISIIGILAAIAIPIYRTQVVSARLTEVTNAMSHIATGVTKYREEESTNVWPNCGSIADIQASLGVALLALDRISSASVSQATGVISVTVTNIDSTVDGRTITLVPSIATDSSIEWNWGGNLPPKLIPKR